MDSGCTQTIILASLNRGPLGRADRVTVANGTSVVSLGTSEVRLLIRGVELRIRCLVMESLPRDFQVILGMDVIRMLGGVNITNTGVSFPLEISAVVSQSEQELRIVDVDFVAEFVGGKWVAAWNWINEPPTMENKLSMYSMDADLKAGFDEEIELWITEGWLVRSKDKEGGILPMMAVDQSNKGKIRPVLDYRELNKYVASHTGDSDVCDATMRRWRRFGRNVAMLDLKKAYLQVHIDPKLWSFQKVRYKGLEYCLTRLGFGLNVAPKIMTAIVRKVLGMRTDVWNGTDSYIDDIIVDLSQVKIETVAEHLRKFGLEVKAHESFDDSKVLGLQITSNNSTHRQWVRSNKIPDLGSIGKVTKRELFSICGQLVGHYPVAKWLRIACSFVKRASEGQKFESYIGDAARKMLLEMITMVNENDPVKGKWHVSGCKSGTIWCDASSIALGACLEIDGDIVEDASWLRKKDDATHINVAELDAVIRGLNLAIKWDLRSVCIKTDSATVNNWVSSILANDHKIRTHGSSEMLIKRRLQIIGELKNTYEMAMLIELVPTVKNKADELTRVKKSWLTFAQPVSCTVDNNFDVIKKCHEAHHFGTDRTLGLIQKRFPGVTKEEVRQVISQCRMCRSIDPAPTTWEKGKLSVDKNWFRLALDVTHYGNHKYLTCVDCGPSRFALWREIRSEDATTISRELEQIFRERGPPNELLMDNSMSFRSKQLKELCEKWGVRQRFRGAYRPSGNGIVERNHRTIKRMAARTSASPLDMVYWYNLAPMEGSQAPSDMLFTYAWKNMEPDDEENIEADNRFHIGDVVFCKPPDSKCTSRWDSGIVTGVLSTTNVEVDGIPRHVADLRMDVSTEPEYDAANLVNDEEHEIIEPDDRDQRSRVRRRPKFLADYVLNSDEDITGECDD